MDASIVDLRYNMRNVLSALNRREKVRILYHGRVKGEIIPCKTGSGATAAKHPMFGMSQKDEQSPSTVVAGLRKGRYDAL